MTHCSLPTSVNVGVSVLLKEMRKSWKDSVDIEILTRRDYKQLSRVGQALNCGATFCCGEHSHQSDFPALDKNSD